MTDLRIGTWNLERPSLRSWKKLPRQRARIEELAADVWVLTETRASISPGDGWHGLHTPPTPRRAEDRDERYVSLWSRWPVEPTSVEPHQRGSVAGLVRTPAGRLLVYGTVIAWANDKGEHGEHRMWQRHAEEIQRQGQEWQQLRDEYPGVPLVVAGDFNQDRDGSGWYGTHHVREMLTVALTAAGLVVVTDADVVQAGLYDHNLVDHVAISTDLLAHHTTAMTVLHRDHEDGTHLSDHPTVVVDLTSNEDT